MCSPICCSFAIVRLTHVKSFVLLRMLHNSLVQNWAKSYLVLKWSVVKETYILPIGTWCLAALKILSCHQTRPRPSIGPFIVWHLSVISAVVKELKTKVSTVGTVNEDKVCSFAGAKKPWTLSNLNYIYTYCTKCLRPFASGPSLLPKVMFMGTRIQHFLVPKYSVNFV